MVGFPNGPFPFAKCFANFRGGHSISSPEIRLFVRAYLTIGFPIGGVGWAAIKTWPHLKFFFVQCGPHLGYCCSPETTSQTKKNVNSWVPKKIWQTLNPPPPGILSSFRNIIQPRAIGSNFMQLQNPRLSGKVESPGGRHVATTESLRIPY